MQLLPVAAPLDGVHHDVLAGHEGQFLHDVLLDDLFVHHQARGDILINFQNGVHSQERFGDGQTLVSGVVQGALKPLGGSGDGRIHDIADDVATQGADAFAAHGVALVGHGGGTDLLLLKRFFYFFHVRQQTQVSGELAGGLGDASQGVEHQHVHLTGIGLAGHGHAAVEAHLRSDLPFQLLDFLMVALKQLQERGLGAGGALAAQQLQVVDAVLHLVEIHQQFVHPKRGTLADRGQLGGLEMGEPQGGQRLVGVSEFGQIVQHPHQLIPHQEKSFPHDDHIGVVSHIAAGSA